MTKFDFNTKPILNIFTATKQNSFDIYEQNKFRLNFRSLQFLIPSRVNVTLTNF